MNPLKIITITTLTLVTSSCGDDSPSINSGDDTSSSTSSNISPSDDVSGSYRLTKMMCNGKRVSITDYSEILTLTDSGGSVEGSSPSCNVREDFSYEFENKEVFLSSNSVSCEDNAPADGDCHVLFKLDGNPVHYRCPGSYPFAIGYWEIKKTTSGITVAKDDECILHYTKQ